MNMIHRAESLLKQTRQAPGMYATRREAFVAHVCGIMTLLDAEFDVREFYGKHLEKHGSILKGIDKEVHEEWGHGVVDDALRHLHGFTSRARPDGEARPSMTFSDWFDYKRLKLKRVLGLLPPPPKGKHVHQCPKCGNFWMHYTEDRQDEVKAHTCPVPGCGGVQFWPVGKRRTDD
jgi:hypothetical protein